MAGSATSNGRRAGAQAQAQAEQAIKDAPAPEIAPTDAPAPTEAPTEAPAPTEAQPDALAQMQAQLAALTAQLAQAPQPQPEPQPQPDAPTGRRAQAQAQTAQASKRATPLVLAHGCEWHKQAGLGKFGVTVEGGAGGQPVREYLTWAPEGGGRVQKLPLYEALYALIDSGALS